MFKKEFHFFRKDSFEANDMDIISEHIEARDEISFIVGHSCYGWK